MWLIFFPCLLLSLPSLTPLFFYSSADAPPTPPPLPLAGSPRSLLVSLVQACPLRDQQSR